MQGFEEFYLGAQSRVLRAVSLVAESEEDARDCVQEAFIRAASRWPALRSDTAEAWVRRVAFNLAFDSHRRRGVRRRLAFRVVADQRPVPAPSEQAMDVARVLRQLPRPQQEVIVLHHLLDMSVQDVARELDRPESTVKAQLVRGRARLAELLSLDDVEALSHDR